MDQDHLDWESAIDILRPFVVKIATPQGWGTGFLFTRTRSGLCGVATAVHVVSHAHFWEEPIRINHPVTGASLLLRSSSRAMFLEQNEDTAGIVFDPGQISFPQIDMPLTPEGKVLRLGVEVGWLGFPVLAPETICFFAGRASAWLEPERRYLVDGVAINGVSGGPTFFLSGPRLTVIGVVSEYRANRATGEALPGLCVVTDVLHFRNVISQLRSLEEAQERQTPHQEAMPAAAPPEDNQGEAAPNTPDRADS